MKVINSFHEEETQLLFQKNPFLFHMEYFFLVPVYGSL